uniref:Uncharacterized protein n=1 Tax=Salix viminalis TaxID=40686 RepID=A0A6N2N553_SALVM
MAVRQCYNPYFITRSLILRLTCSATPTNERLILSATKVIMFLNLSGTSPFTPHPIRQFENATPIREVPWRLKHPGGEEVRRGKGERNPRGDCPTETGVIKSFNPVKHFIFVLLLKIWGKERNQLLTAPGWTEESKATSPEEPGTLSG